MRARCLLSRTFSLTPENLFVRFLFYFYWYGTIYNMITFGVQMVGLIILIHNSLSVKKK